MYLNEALAELLGETAKNSNFATYVDPGAHEVLESVALPAVHTSGTWRGDLTLRTTTGGSMPVSAMLVAHVGNGGACEAISIVARDQTELRATQERLMESENRMHALVENSADLLVLLTAEGAVQYASPAVERVLAHPPGSLDGIDIVELIHPEDLQSAYDLIAEVLSLIHI